MEDRIHVAVFPAAGSGHENPMLEFARHLVPLGFKVTFLVTESSFAKIQNEGSDFIRFVSIPNPEPGPVSFILSSEVIQESVEAALQSLVQTPVRCIISDFFIGWSQELAKRMSIPRIAFVTCSSTAEQYYYHLPLLIAEGIAPVSAALLEDNKMVTCVPGAEPIHPKQLPLAFRTNGPLIMNQMQKLKPLHPNQLPLAMAFRKTGPGVPMIANQMQKLKESTCILVNTVEELEQQVVSNRRLEKKYYLPIGPLIQKTSVDSSSTKPCIEWLDKQAPSSVLYVAFGSNVLIPVEKVEVLAEALERTGRPFLWAMRKGLAENAAEGFFESLMKRLEDSEQGLVTEWAPQTQVLEHKSVGAFLTHCGWNSTIEAGAAGVPALCWPCGAEQNVNADIVVDKWKMGLHVASEGSEERVTVEGIVAQIEIAMTQEELRSRAQEIQRIMTSSHAEGGSSHKNLQTLKTIILQQK